MQTYASGILSLLGSTLLLAGIFVQRRRENDRPGKLAQVAGQAVMAVSLALMGGEAANAGRGGSASVLFVAASLMALAAAALIVKVIRAR